MGDSSSQVVTDMCQPSPAESCLGFLFSSGVLGRTPTSCLPKKEARPGLSPAEDIESCTWIDIVCREEEPKHWSAGESTGGQTKTWLIHDVSD